jgi:hypothetical protein
VNRRIPPGLGSVFALAVAMGCVAPVDAGIELFQVDPAQSVLTLTGTTGGIGWQEQSTGTMSTSWDGWLVADLGGSTIRFVVGSTINGRQVQEVQPGSPIPTVASTADFGAQWTFGSGLSATHALGAVRNLHLDVASDPVPLSGGIFDPSLTHFTVAPTDKPTLDFRANGLLVESGHRSLTGLASANAALNGTFGLFAEVQTLTLPVDITLPVGSLPGGDTTLRLTGKIVARRGIMIRLPVLLQLPSASVPGQFTLVWPSEYQLQRATTLNPPDWTPVTDPAPLDIAPDGEAAFYRAVSLF